MAMKAGRVDVWVASMKDQPGALAEKLDALAGAGANLDFVIARRSDTRPTTGVVFLTPLKGAKQLSAARKNGFHKSKSLHSVRVECPNKKGLGARLTCALAEAGINLRGISAASIGRQCVTYFAFDSAGDAATALRIFKKL